MPEVCLRDWRCSGSPCGHRVQGLYETIPHTIVGEVIVDLDAQVTAPEAQSYSPMRKHGVCRHTITWWRTAGHVEQIGLRGRSPLYRWGDLLQAERDTRMSGLSRRSSRCRSCERTAERELVSA